MSINFISGKPGGGKTLYSVRLIIDELVRGNRPIVTNVPLNLGRLNEYLQNNYPAYAEKLKDGLHITDRITVIDEDDLGKFFTFRGGGVRLESVTNAEWKTGKRPDFSKVKDSGVLYVLDEVHIAFNSRAWADTGAEVLYYLSQHRKLGDDVICITQSIGNVDKQFRSVAQDYTYIKNLSKQRAGMFRLPSVFTRNTYAQPATDTSKPMESGTFSLDMSGIASCYDTARGVGIHGRSGADTNARKKGIHWIFFVVGLPILLWAILHFLPQIFGYMTSPHKASGHGQPTNSVPSHSAVAPNHVAADAHMDPLQKTNPPATSENETNAPEIVCTGFLILSGRPLVFLSDGLTYEPPEVEKVEKRQVTVSGRVYKLCAPHQYTEQITWQSVPVQIPSSPDAPVNQAIVLPTMHGKTYGNPSPPSLNGFQNMRGLQ